MKFVIDKDYPTYNKWIDSLLFPYENPTDKLYTNEYGASMVLCGGFRKGFFTYRKQFISEVLESEFDCNFWVTEDIINLLDDLNLQKMKWVDQYRKEFATTEAKQKTFQWTEAGYLHGCDCIDTELRAFLYKQDKKFCISNADLTYKLMTIGV